MLQLIGVALQSLLTLLLFARLDGAVQMVVGGGQGDAAAAAVGHGQQQQQAAAERGLVVARWVLLCLLLPVQSAALALGMATTCCGFRGFGGEGGADAEALAAAAAPDQAARLGSLAALRGDVERGGGGGGGGGGSSPSTAALGVGAMYERTRGALAAKYGKALAASSFWRWR